ncbi:MAG: hypothetical protein JHC93_08785 [Parachlamydiales bacterium]|nr:hypothetical protein [Parachlamydiales bacterium]
MRIPSLTHNPFIVKATRINDRYIPHLKQKVLRVAGIIFSIGLMVGSAYKSVGLMANTPLVALSVVTIGYGLGLLALGLTIVTTSSYSCFNP